MERGMSGREGHDSATKGSEREVMERKRHSEGEVGEKFRNESGQTPVGKLGPALPNWSQDLFLV